MYTVDQKSANEIFMIFQFRLFIFSLILLILSAFAFRAVAEDSDQSSGPLIGHADLVFELNTYKTNRMVDLRISYPVGEAQYPLIVFSHGHFLDNKSYQHLTDHWVANGYIVIAPKHIDSGDMDKVSALSKKVGSDWVWASRILELSSIIDNAKRIMASLGEFEGSVTIERVIAAGHSLGALSSQQLAGAALERQSNSLYSIPDTLSDERIVGVVAVSPPGLMPDYLSKRTWKNFSTPQLVVTGTKDFFPNLWPNYQDHFVSYHSAVAGNNYLLVLNEVDHYFGNLIGRLERKETPQVNALNTLKEISLKFIKSYLTGDDKAFNKFVKGDPSKGKDIVLFEHR